MKFNVHVNPGSKKPGIEKIDKITYRVKVDAPPEKGEANHRLIEMLSGYFKVPKSNVRILAGEKSKVKIVEVIGYE